MPQTNFIYVHDSFGNVVNVISDGRLLTPDEQHEHLFGFGGIGTSISSNELGIVVMRVYEKTPAQTAGIIAGDIILSVDGTPLKDLSLVEAVKCLRGRPGSIAELYILRPGQTNPIPISVVREIIRAP